MSRQRKIELHELLVKRTAVKTMQMEDIVEKVLSHEKRGVNMALRTLNEVEISGFGKFYLSQIKLRNRLNYLEKTRIKLEEKLKLEPEHKETLRDMERIVRDQGQLKTRVLPDENRFQGVVAGDEEHLLPPLSDQGGDRDTFAGEDKGL